MPLIDTTYFDYGLTFIAQLDLVYNRNRVNRFINQYEPEYLNKVLGVKLSAAFISGLAEPVIEQRWLNLRDGADFQFMGRTKKWGGFLNSDKISPIAMYVFYWHMRKQASPNTGSGNVLSSMENGTRASYMRDGVLVWNEMVEQNNILLEFLSTNASLYPEWEATCSYPAYRWHYGFGWHLPFYMRRYNNTEQEMFTVINHLNI